MIATAVDARLASLCVPLDATIEDAMRAIGRGAVEIALVVDRDGRLRGTVTDGDVRRALLAGSSMSDLVVLHSNLDCTTVGPDTDRAWALDLMVRRGLGQLPVVDACGRLVGLHVLREVVGQRPRDEVAVVWAGGLGTRLRPVTETVPKPMLEVAGRPILERIVLQLVGAGLRRFYLAVNYHADQIEDWFGDGRDHGCSIRYLREDPAAPLGTAGALSLLPDHVRDGDTSVLVMNGDVMSTFDPVALLDRHAAERPLVTVGASTYVHDVPFGVLDVVGGHLADVHEKPRVSWPVSAGVNVLDPAAVRLVPRDERHDMTDLIAACRDRGPVAVHMIDEDWVDVGRPADLRHARGETTRSER